MPRETVPTHPSDDEFVVKIGWQKDTHMQVGIETPEGPSGQLHLVDYFYGDQQAAIGEAFWDALTAGGDGPLQWPGHEQAGRMILDAVTGSAEGPSTGLWWTPSRYQANALLRLVRKARDAAFGRDE